jgi:hypothetical protein
MPKIAHRVLEVTEGNEQRIFERGDNVKGIPRFGIAILRAPSAVRLELSPIMRQAPCRHCTSDAVSGLRRRSPGSDQVTRPPDRMLTFLKCQVTYTDA